MIFNFFVQTIFIITYLISLNTSHAKSNECLNYLEKIKKINLTKTKEYKTAIKKFPKLKAVNEYSSLTETVIMHASGLAQDGYKLYQAYLLNLPPDVKTLLIGTESDYNNFVQFNFGVYARKSSDGKPLDNFLVVENETPTNNDMTIISRWIQDNLGQWVEYAYGDTYVQGLVTSNYRFNFQASHQVVRALGSNVIHNINANHEWGNFTVIGDTAYLIAGARTPPNLNLNEFAYTGVKNLVILPRPVLGETPLGIPHSDEFFVALSDQVIATNYSMYADYFKSEGFEVILLPSLAEVGFDFLTYTNAVVLNSLSEKIIFVPQFKKLSAGTLLAPNVFVTQDLQALFKTNDELALRQFQNFGQKHGVKIVPVDIPETSLRNYGGPHCLTGLCVQVQNPDIVPWAKRGFKNL